MANVLVAISDLMFLSKVQATARQLGTVLVRADPSQPLWQQAAAGGVRLVLVDLAHPMVGAAAVEELRSHAELKDLPVVGYCRHTREDLIQAGKAAGCTQVLTQGEFSAQLPRLLS